VTTAGIDSGTAATTRLTEAIAIATTGSPPSTPTAKTTADSATVTSPSSRPSPARRRCSGVGPGRLRAIAAAMRPSALRSPVRVTSPAARPVTTTVPANASCPASWQTATDSPVSADSSTANRYAVCRRRSAGTMSPASSSTRSPTTSSAAGTSTSVPSRTALAVGAAMASRAAMALSARISLGHPDRGVHDHHERDDRRVRDVADPDRDHERGDQQQHQGVELPSDPGRQRGRTDPGHGVRSILGQPDGRPRRRQAGDAGLHLRLPEPTVNAGPRTRTGPNDPVLTASRVEDGGRAERRKAMTSLVPRLWSELSEWFEQDGVLRGSGLIRLEARVSETEYTLGAELPGLDPEKDVQISVANGVLTIRAERREQAQTGHRSEFRYGMFSRSVRLPGNADEDAVQAHYDKGILEITVPLREQPTAKRVKITSA
jgi:HSP20 family molecular chaperone IbpA